MPDYNTLNYTEQGGAKTVIGGTLDLTGATVEGVVTAPVVDALNSTSATSALSAKQGKALNDTKLTAVKALNQAASVEATSPTVAEFNALLAKLKAAGLMVADE